MSNLSLCSPFTLAQVTLEEQMICGALQTLNEEAFEDVASNEIGVSATGETLGQQLAPIREGSEFSLSLDSGLGTHGAGRGIGGGGSSRTNTDSQEVHITMLLDDPSAEEQFLHPGGNTRDATIIPMSPFSKNFGDTPL